MHIAFQTEKQTGTFRP